LPQTVRAIAGPVSVTTMKPCTPGGTGVPSSSTIAVARPGSARVAHPGLNAASVWRGESTVAPVSDCHHVSTIGTPPGTSPPESRPMFSRSHRHASGFTASPTVPRTRMDEKSYSAGTPSGNQPMSERTSVGAV
jgi:hypothetical protein